MRLHARRSAAEDAGVDPAVLLDALRIVLAEVVGKVDCEVIGDPCYADFYNVPRPMFDKARALVFDRYGVAYEWRETDAQ